MPYHIFIIDSDPFQCKSLQLKIEEFSNYQVSTETNPIKAFEYISSPQGENIDMVILDPYMRRIKETKILEQLILKKSDLPIIVNVTHENVKKASETVKKGAIEFIEKQSGIDRIKLSIENARRISGLKKQVSKLIKPTDKYCEFGSIIGKSKNIKRTVNTARKAAKSNISVLLRGESGVGKELFARAIHSSSLRANKPFVAVNCSAIPEKLVESILFGHEKGAFTGADKKSIGKFREAEGGTIFLDEVGELPLETQSKLLRVLQNYEVEPVGSEKTYPVNVRIISATNKNLEEDIKHQNFREDLYYRINVLGINIPPLRERKEDIDLLVKHFIEKICVLESLPIFSYSREIPLLLAEYRWPGNVRQLENTIYRAIVLNETNRLDLENFDLMLKSIDSNIKNNKGTKDLSKIEYFSSNKASFKTLAEYEKDIIQNALEFYNWNISKVSKILDIGRSTLYRKMKEYEIEGKSNIEEIAAFRNRK